MARPDRGGDLAEAAVTEPVGTEVVDDGVEELLSGHPGECTVWFMNQVVQIEVTSKAPPEAVFALLADTAGWTSWAPMDEAERVAPAPEGHPEGVGALRRFRRGRTVSRERVVAFEPGVRFGYELLSGLPLRDYRAEVSLHPEGGGTRIVWRSTFRPKVPGTGWLFRTGLSRFIADVARRLATAAATSATPGAQSGGSA